jgi:hypothetical protein
MRTVVKSDHVSLAADIAQRAAIRSAGDTDNRAMSFAKALFAEASNYLVSRDLPGYIGPAGRARNISEAVQLKGAVRQEVEGIVSRGPQPPTSGDSSAWSAYVKVVVEQLRSRNK